MKKPGLPGLFFMPESDHNAPEQFVTTRGGNLRFLAILLAAAFIGLGGTGLAADETSSATQPDVQGARFLETLSRDFFEWRRVQQPAQGDDIPRVERPDGWLPDFSPEALEAYRQRYQDYMVSLDTVEMTGLSVEDQVDARLLRAAVERVHWELEVLKAPNRNPLFYVDQTLGSVFELLIISSPMTPARAENILLRLEHFPQMIRWARKNLDQAVRPFAEVTIDTLADIEQRLRRMEAGLEPLFPEELISRLHRDVTRAISSLQNYSSWLQKRLKRMRTAFAIGPNAYQWFLVNVALVPYTPDELLAQGRQAWNRAVAWDVLERNRNSGEPALSLFRSTGQQVQASAVREQEIRAFLESRKLMTIPPWLKHYRNRPMPEYLEPLSFMGVSDDLTSETRLDEDAYRYIWEPEPGLPYFNLSAARDPRPLIIHEGVPGHYYQMALSWANPNPVRRRYIDSSVNEGIAFYVEELLLQAGLFDFSPRSREIIYSYSRLRALRVEIDIRLAVGDFTIEQAADYLARAVPMDRETALEEAVFFAFNPGQAISYQVGKLQILGFLADASLDQGDDFSLLDFHGFLMQNGNVPIALQRWEYLGRDDAVLRLDALGGKHVTVPQ
jgi:uncharacterized protein (DUF885 family)